MSERTITVKSTPPQCETLGVNADGFFFRSPNATDPPCSGTIEIQRYVDDVNSQAQAMTEVFNRQQAGYSATREDNVVTLESENEITITYDGESLIIE